jgi:very-short-patch-repair endonuclease
MELDSRQAHETSRAFEEDRRRDRDLLTNGYRVIRITARQLRSDQATIATQLRTLLTRP